MATELQRPTSTTLAGTYTIVGGASNTYEAIDEAVTDDADSLQKTGGTTRGEFGYTAFSVPAGSTINFVRIVLRGWNNGVGSNSQGAHVDINGTDYDSSTQNLSTTPTDYSFDWATNPATAAPWTVDEVNGVGTTGLDAMGHRFAGVGGSEVADFSQGWILVDYTPAAAGGPFPELFVPDSAMCPAEISAIPY
ncbi:MAG: hypothetical protein AB7I42_24265 [Bradyrhizobium sp.]|uniref:hypothetical protein n=1 Tax=Bradyrhizobium sp. TaxID=376 RepID=UPI003D0EF824